MSVFASYSMLKGNNLQEPKPEYISLDHCSSVQDPSSDNLSNHPQLHLQLL